MTEPNMGSPLTLNELEALYGEAAGASLIKVADHLTPHYTAWISRSRFCILSTVGPEGTDATPRGDDGPVVRVRDAHTLLLPDWRGNNRIDNLRNIARDSRASLMFFINGSNNVIRVNGKATLHAGPELLASFDRNGKTPRSVIAMTVEEVYSQCARALLRAGVWNGESDTDGLPSMGDILAEQKAGFDAKRYDDEWAGRAAKTMW